MGSLISYLTEPSYGNTELSYNITKPPYSFTKPSCSITETQSRATTKLKPISEHKRLHINSSTMHRIPGRKFLCQRTILTTEDIDKGPSDIKPNIIRGSYKNVEQYLDIHLLLLREDFLRPIREAVAWCRRNSSVGGNKFRIYHNVKGLKRCYDNFGKTFKLSVPTAQSIKWTTTKKLETGNLVCLSPDSFHTLVFAVIDQQFSPEPGTCIIHIKIESGDSCNKDLDFSKTYTLVETGVFYEAYSHVLRVLQDMAVGSINFPFPEYFVSLSKICKRPKYQTSSVTFSVPDEIRDNLNQAEAFQHALTSELAIIQGPPGTGKTFISLKIIETLIQYNKPVLVICYTNHALDQFLEGTLAFTSKVVRIGSRSESIKLQPHYLSNIREAIREWKKKLRNQDSALDGNSERSEMLNRSLNVALSLVKGFQSNAALGSVISKIKELLVNLHNISSELDTLECQPLNSKSLHLRVFTTSSTCSQLSDSKKSKIKKLNKFLLLESQTLNHYLIVQEFRQKLSEARKIASDLHALEDELASDSVSDDEISQNNRSQSTPLANQNKNKHYVLKQNFTNISKEFEKLNISDNSSTKIPTCKSNAKIFLSCQSEINIFAEKLFEMKDQMTIKEVQAVHDVWQLSLVNRWRFCRYWRCHLIELLKRKLNAAENLFNEMVENFHEELCLYNCKIIQHADIIGVTTTGASKNRSLIELLKPKIVLVEEAAEVLEAHTIASIIPETEHLILVGDHQQLRPIPSNYDLAQNYNLDISLFERLVSSGVPYRRLEIQRRMRPCIAQLLVPTIYPSLHSHRSVYQYPDIRGMKDNMYFFSHNQPESSCAGKSHSNPYEARFVLSLCTYLLKQGYREADITVLATYSGQQAYLSNIFKSSNLTGVYISTVDNFQGEENDIILLSFVRSNTRGNLGFLKVSNRMCVALSRARKGLYCFGNFEMFSENSVLWHDIVSALKTQKKIGNRLTLQCVQHPSSIAVVSSLAALKKYLTVSRSKCSYPHRY